jgi:hypothetical protein
VRASMRDEADADVPGDLSIDASLDRHTTK